MRDLARLLNPRSLAVVGGGAWCRAVVAQARLIGFGGLIWPVHPKKVDIAGEAAFAALAELPDAPDAVFLGVNRDATVDLTAQLARLGAGGAVCFASGFSEADAEDAMAARSQDRLVVAAGDMPILGPNCYGFVNALDRVAVWPDQHGMVPVENGVAILTQSSNIAINLTQQRRALPIAMMATCGNMAQTSQADIALALLDDPRVTVLGLHVEGFGDLRQWERLAARAFERSVPVVVMKVGASQQAQRAAVSHTASLAGSAAGADAFISRLGFARVRTVPEFLETLKLLHCQGSLRGRRLAAISCSGGEASLVADMAVGRELIIEPLSTAQRNVLRGVLGPKVALANPLDYHTYIWRDADRMAAAWGCLAQEADITISVVDYPHTDASDWDCATRAALRVAETGGRIAVAATLPELMPEDIAQRLMAGGVAPMNGLAEALAASEAAASLHPPDPAPVLLPGPGGSGLLDEIAAKAALAAFGVPVPESRQADSPAGIAEAASGLRPPLALKGQGVAHKTEAGAIRLGLSPDEVEEAANAMQARSFLIENMVAGGVVELLIGITRDAAHGFVLTLGAGGVQTELLQDTASLLLPASDVAVLQALQSLRIAPLLSGYRGQPAVDISAILDIVRSVAAYVTDHAESLEELEINPLICTPTGAVAVDALIRKADP